MTCFLDNNVTGNEKQNEMKCWTAFHFQYTAKSNWQFCNKKVTEECLPNQINRAPCSFSKLQKDYPKGGISIHSLVQVGKYLSIHR